MRDSFGMWLQQQREKLGISQAELARLAGLNRAVVNKMENNATKPEAETLLATSRALKLPPETVFRAAGLLPPKPEHNERITEATYILSMLEEEDIDEIIQIARMKLERKKASSPRTSRKVKPPAQTVLNGQ